MTRPDLDAIEQWAKPAADQRAFRDDVTACQRLLEIVAYARELERVLEPICQTIIDPLVTDAKRVLEDR